MPSRIYKGSFAELSLRAIQRAEEMQVLATHRIGQDWETEDVPDDDPLDNLTGEQILDYLERAVQRGEGAAAEQMIVDVLLPLLQAQQQQAQQGAANGGS